MLRKLPEFSQDARQQPRVARSQLFQQPQPGAVKKVKKINRQAAVYGSCQELRSRMRTINFRLKGPSSPDEDPRPGHAHVPSENAIDGCWHDWEQTFERFQAM
jgi:hypothetical protein